MRRFYLVTASDNIEAEGVLFYSGLAAVSFFGEHSGVMTWPDMRRARHIHRDVGGRFIAWAQNEVPGDVLDVRGQNAYLPDGTKVWVYLEP